MTPENERPNQLMTPEEVALQRKLEEQYDWMMKRAQESKPADSRIEREAQRMVKAILDSGSITKTVYPFRLIANVYEHQHLSLEVVNTERQKQTFNFRLFETASKELIDLAHAVRRVFDETVIRREQQKSFTIPCSPKDDGTTGASSPFVSNFEGDSLTPCAGP